jgi:hypothetical protein
MGQIPTGDCELFQKMRYPEAGAAHREFQQAVKLGDAWACWSCGCNKATGIYATYLEDNETSKLNV